MGKIRCKNAARNRRSDENEQLSHLSDLLPLNSCKKLLDKATVVRLTTAYIRLKEITGGFDRGSGSRKHKQCCGLEEPSFDILQSLDGFLLIVGLDGKTIYVSETVSNHLGLSQIEMTGDLIYGYIHPEDKSELESLLISSADFPAQNSTQDSVKIPVKFSIRMKCSLSRRYCAFAVGGFKIIHCSGYLKFGANVLYQYGSVPIIQSRNQTRSHTGSGLILTCHSFPSSIETAIRMSPQMFMFRLGLDFTISYADGEVFALTGYEPSYLLGKNLYNFLHPQQMLQIQRQHTILLKKTQAITPYYAFLTNGGGWIWMQSYFVRMKYGKPPRDSIIACNYIISERQHVNLVVQEEQARMLNSCFKVSKYNKKTTSPSNNAFSKRSNNAFDCCFSSAEKIERFERDNTVTSRKVGTLTKENDINENIKQVLQSCASTHLTNGNYLYSELLKHLNIPFSSSGNVEKFCTDNLMSENFRDRTICNPVFKEISDQSSPTLSINSTFQKISKTCEFLKSLQKIHDSKAVIDIDKKAFSNGSNGCMNISCEKDSFDFQAKYAKPTNFDFSIPHQQNNNESSILTFPKLDGDARHSKLKEIYPFPKKFEQTEAVPLSANCGVDDSLSWKSESILKTLLSKSPDICHPSSSKIPHFSFANNSTSSNCKGHLMHPTYSKLNLKLPSTDNKSLNLKHSKLLSPVSETAMDFNCLQIQRFENESSEDEDPSICSNEFPSTSTSNIRQTSHDFLSVNAKRMRSDYSCIENNNSVIDPVVPLQKHQTEINNNQLYSQGTGTYNCLLGNTIASSTTKFFFSGGHVIQGIQTTAIPEKENLTTPPWSTNRNSQQQYSERKVLSLKQELNISDFNKNAQYFNENATGGTKALASSVVLDRLNISTYFPNQSFETKILSPSSESDLPETEQKFRTSEIKNMSSSLKLPMSSDCNSQSQIPFTKELNEDDFSEIKILNVYSDTQNLFSSVTFENASQLVTDLSNGLNSTFEPETSDQKLLEDILHT